MALSQGKVNFSDAALHVVWHLPAKTGLLTHQASLKEGDHDLLTSLGVSDELGHGDAALSADENEEEDEDNQVSHIFSFHSFLAGRGFLNECSSFIYFRIWTICLITKKTRMTKWSAPGDGRATTQKTLEEKQSRMNIFFLFFCFFFSFYNFFLTYFRVCLGLGKECRWDLRCVRCCYPFSPTTSCCLITFALFIVCVAFFSLINLIERGVAKISLKKFKQQKKRKIERKKKRNQKSPEPPSRSFWWIKSNTKKKS